VRAIDPVDGGLFPPATRLISKTVISYSYNFDAAGLLTSYTEHTLSEERRDELLVSLSESTNTFPVSCYRIP
jgi:hypothetical protein